MYRDPIKNCRSPYIILQIPPIILVDKDPDMDADYSNTPVVDKVWIRGYVEINHHHQHYVFYRK